MSNIRIIAIDPSVNYIGLAWAKKANLIDLHMEDVNPNTPYDDSKRNRIVKSSKYLWNSIIRFGLENSDIGIIEYPNFQNSVRGKIAAQQGSTLDLAFMVGYIVGKMPNTSWYLPTPIQWKGTMPKEVVGRKFTRWSKIDYQLVSDHSFEAAMMIKWYLDLSAREKIEYVHI